MTEMENFKVTDIKVQPSSELCDSEQLVPTYATHSKKRGAVLMINNIVYTYKFKRRTSAENDSILLEELFLQIGLEVESHIDLTGEQMKEVITTFKTSSKTQGVDMVLIIIMGHGYEDVNFCGIRGIDGVDVTTRWVEEQFDDMYCRALLDVPKIIMYQTCCEKIMAYEPRSRRYVSDLLIVHSTMQVDAPACNSKICSLYINYLCKTIMEYAHCTDFEAMLRMTENELPKTGNNEMVHHKSSYMNFGFKKCYLHPKMYVEDGKIKSIHGSTKA